MRWSLGLPGTEEPRLARRDLVLVDPWQRTLATPGTALRPVHDQLFFPTPGATIGLPASQQTTTRPWPLVGRERRPAR